MKRQANTFLLYFTFYLISPIIFYFASGATDAAHMLLCKILPSLFKEYSSISEKDAYFAQRALITFVAGILTLVFISIISVLFDNGKNEIMIKKTEGFYTVRQGMKIYIREFWISEFVISLAVPSLFIIPTLIPLKLDSEKYGRLFEFLNSVFAPTAAFTDYIGNFCGIFVILFISLTSRIPAALLGVDRWRSIWLSDIERGL